MGLPMLGSKLVCVCVCQDEDAAYKSRGNCDKGTLILADPCVKEDEFITRPSSETLITCCRYATRRASVHTLCGTQLRKWARRFFRPEAVVTKIVRRSRVFSLLGHTSPHWHTPYLFTPSSTAQRMTGHAQVARAAGLVCRGHTALRLLVCHDHLSWRHPPAPQPYSSRGRGMQPPSLSHRNSPYRWQAHCHQDVHAGWARAPCVLFGPPVPLCPSPR